MEPFQIESRAHDCRCAQVDVTSLFLANADWMVAKALVVSEVAQIARAEMRARTLLLNQWRIRSHQAVTKAEKGIVAGYTLSAVLNGVDAIMDKWVADVRPGFTKEITTCYK